MTRITLEDGSGVVFCDGCMRRARIPHEKFLPSGRRVLLCIRCLNKAEGKPW